MDQLSKKRRIVEFLKQNKVAVLSTITPDGKPESATVEYVLTDKLEIIFNTFATYRKYRNLKNNASVAIVVGFKDKTVQYEGLAGEAKGKEQEECKKLHASSIKHKTKFHEMPETRYFKVSPKWIRYADYSKKPWELFEILF
ncbi:pyridoxamine 5'-phosphate oxidase family protein [Candidatus Woesearchaeota archaeon]|nr:pyridoxamine 5'-phosphate oxidase family protein [Candidatus Woesearchaeota archaeon]